MRWGGGLNGPHAVHRVTEGPCGGGGGGGGGTSLCGDCRAESLQIMMRADFIQPGLCLLFFFSARRSRQKLCSGSVGCDETLFLEEVMRFDAITARPGERRLAPFK